MNYSKCIDLQQSDSQEHPDSKQLIAREKAMIRDFCEFINFVPIGETFSLWNVQGALRFANPGVPAKQKYEDYLRIATVVAWIEPVSGQPDTYWRTKSRMKGRSKSAYMDAELQALKKTRLSSAGIDG